MVYKITDTNNVSSLFDKWDETLIWSCLQGMMGKIYADDLYAPTAAMAMIGDFAFFAGKPGIELVSYKPAWCTRNFMIMVPQNKFWENAILDYYGERATVISRYAIKKEPDVFDKEKLEKAVASLPKQYTLSMIDERLYQMCRAEAWSADLVSQFPDYDNYRKFGIGTVICKEDVIISGASYRDRD